MMEAQKLKVGLLSLETKWRSLLVSSNLRPYIIHYGEMAQACYDAFNGKEFMFSEADLFKSVGLLSHSKDYEITKFISTTVFLIDKSCRTSSVNTSAFVCVKTSMGVRDIVISWRGTDKKKEWIHNSHRYPVKAKDVIKGDKNLRIHSGWLSAYTSHCEEPSARDQVIEEVKRLVNYYKLEKGEEVSITITGHSLGAALAVINAADIVTNGINQECEVTVIAFAQPRVGNKTFCRTLAKYPKLRIVRVENKFDIVPHLPKLFGYRHVDDLVLKIDTTKSIYVKYPRMPTIAHNLEVYLHGVDGEGRDIRLMNKGKRVLRKRFRVKKNWWQDSLKMKLDGSYPYQENYEEETIIHKLKTYFHCTRVYMKLDGE